MAATSESNHVRLVGAVAGIGSGLTKVAVGHGFDTIKTRLQCSPPGTYFGAMDCFRKLVRNESIFALYKGALPPALGWSMIDSVLLGSLHNYRLALVRYDLLTEPGVKVSATGDLTDVRRLTPLGHGLAGLCAGLTSAFIATPVEQVKVRLQLQLQRSAKDREFKGMLDCAKQIVRRRGVLGLWTGFTGSLAFRANFFFMFFSVEILMRQFATFKGTSLEFGPEIGSFLAGGLGSFVFWGFAIPADNIKNRLMAAPLANSGPRRSFLAVAKDTYRIDGSRAFFYGLTPTLLRAFPTNAAAYFAYEQILRFLGAEQTRH